MLDHLVVALYPIGLVGVLAFRCYSARILDHSSMRGKVSSTYWGVYADSAHNSNATIDTPSARVICTGCVVNGSNCQHDFH